MTTIRTPLDQRLDGIKDRLLAMIDLVAVRVGEVTDALLQLDVATADSLIIGDDELDLMSQDVEDLCIDTLLRDQPVGRDLRSIVAAMHMNSDIERSGDLTTNIAKAVGRLQGSRADDRIRNLIVRMGEEAQGLFRQSGVAYRDLDAELAASIDELDDVLDDLHREYIQAVIDGATHSALLPQQALQFALIGRFYERIGDHAENLGERIRFIVDNWTPERAGADRARAAATDSLDDGVVYEDEVARSRGLAVIDSIAEERRIDATRRDFVANVSHELKTPVGAIALMAETLADAGPDDDRERLTQHLTREVKRVGDIIDDLLELTRLEEFDPEFVPVAVDELVDVTVDAVQGLADARGIDVAAVGTPTGVEIPGERRQLVRALVNLVDNAIRYSTSGSQVMITVDPLVDRVEIAVSDRGAGIPRPELERVFERFYRVDRARSRDTGGTGLGLAIVRHVADNHGGRVIVESTVGVGSRFSLQLPRKVAEQEPAADQQGGRA